MATDFMTLKASLGLDSSEYEKGMKNAEGKAKGFGGKWGTAMKVLKTGAAVGAAAIGAASTAVGALAKKSVDAYANFEQLKGGVEKLYGSSADELMRYANTAFKRSGMSANQYMEQATSFSAALINSLGGDTSAAAKQTDVAMKAIADNFNTFGGDISNVQNAFQGFAKQNYTMLDNLKLGYGGTKTEMERLIADANAYAEANGKAADLSIDSFSDIVTAIDLIQEKQGIRGATEAEANKTIEGSLMALKGAWENLVTGFANPDADIGALVVDVMERVGIAAQNLGPAIMQALGGIGEAFSVMLPEIMAGIPDAITNYGVPLVTAGAELVGSLVQGLTQAAPSIISTAFKLVGDLLVGIANKLPSIVIGGLNLITSLIQGITDGSANLTGRFGEILKALGQAIVDALPELGAAMLGLLEALGNYILETNWLAIAYEALMGIADAVKAVAPIVWEAAKALVDRVINALGFKGLVAKVRSVFDGVRSAIQNKANAARARVSSVVSAIKSVMSFSGLAGKVADVFESVKTKVQDKIQSIKDKVQGMIDSIKSKFPFSIGKVFSGFIRKPSLSISKKADGGATSSMSTSDEHFAKAMSQPYMFTQRTLFNQYAGEAGHEILYGRHALMNDIAEATRGAGGTINIYLNYQAGNDANDMLKDVARGIQRYKMAGVI